MTLSSKRYWIAFGVISCSLILLVIGIVKGFTETPSDASQTWKIESTIYDLSLSPDGQLILISTNPNLCWPATMFCAPTTIQLHRTDTGDLVHSWEATNAQFHPDGHLLVTNGPRGINFLAS
jgi:hypothetical protein